MEIRVYYESLEQGYNYIVPYIKQAIGKKAYPIQLVKRPNSNSQLVKGSSLAAIHSMIKPDVLITGINNNVEYPLAVIEFSEAVTTEDHELQRTAGAVAACLANAYYIKISGHKVSSKLFGGATYNPYSTPKMFSEKLNYNAYIIADWKTDVRTATSLKRNKEFPACPPDIELLKDTIFCVIDAFMNHSTKWYDVSLQSLALKESYKSFLQKVKEATGSKTLLEIWKQRDIRQSNKNRVRFFVNDKSISVKINRFSHAMDPDRGILTFISFLFSNTHQIYGFYSLVRQRSKGILKADVIDIKSLKAKVNAAIEKDKGGVPKWFSEGILDIIKSATRQDEEIDIQDFWQTNQDKITQNKVVMTIAYFSDALFLNHNGIKLYWDRNKLINNSTNDFVKAIKSMFGFNDYIAPTTLEKVTKYVDEDEVTYTLAHKVFIPNGFEIVFISYPGAQGGGSILPERHKGKAQPREYPDIVALPPKTAKDIDVLVNESKGMFDKTKVEKDVEKVLRYKHEPKLKNALKEALVVAKVINKSKVLENVIIGISFGTEKGKYETWSPADVDFILRIVDRENWAIGIFNQALHDVIPIIAGNTDFPDIYVLPKQKKAKKKRTTKKRGKSKGLFNL